VVKIERRIQKYIKICALAMAIIIITSFTFGKHSCAAKFVQGPAKRNYDKKKEYGGLGRNLMKKKGDFISI
jgi:hypothetical protein